MAISTTFTTSCKEDLFGAVTDFDNGADSIKTALYTSSATLDASTTAYSATNETSGTGYTATGQANTNVSPTTSGTTAFIDFNDNQWTSSSFTARGMLNYNDDASDVSCSTHDFGGDKTVSSGTFTVEYPTADASNAVMRIA